MLTSNAFGGFGDKAKKKLKVDESVGGAVGGAVLGGLLLGPFGAILGGQFGANFGAESKQARQADAALRRKGITPEIAAAVQECAEGLRDAEEALRTTRDVFTAQLQDAAALDAEVSELYNMASAAVQSGNDDAARRHLAERKRVQVRLDDAKVLASEAKGRMVRVEQSVASLATQARRLEGVLKSNMADAAETNAAAAAAKFEGTGDAYSSSPGSLEDEDPLERKFRELEGR